MGLCVWALVSYLPWLRAGGSGRSQRPSYCRGLPPSGLSGHGFWPDARVWFHSPDPEWSWGSASADCQDCWLSSTYSLWRVKKWRKEWLTKAGGNKRKKECISVKHLNTTKQRCGIKMTWLNSCYYCYCEGLKKKWESCSNVTQSASVMERICRI